MATRPVPVDFGDGKSRSLRYGSRVIRTIIEPQLGKDIYTVCAEDKLSHRALAVLLYAGLVAESPKLKLDDVDELIDEFCQKDHDLYELWEPIAKALLEAGVFRPAKRANGAAGPPEPAGPAVETAPGT